MAVRGQQLAGQEPLSRCFSLRRTGACGGIIHDHEEGSTTQKSAEPCFPSLRCFQVMDTPDELDEADEAGAHVHQGHTVRTLLALRSRRACSRMWTAF